MDEKLIYLSLGLLALVGIFLTFVLVGRARKFDRQAAQTERESKPISPVGKSEEIPIPTRVESTPGSFKQATPAAKETTASANF